MLNLKITFEKPKSKQNEKGNSITKIFLIVAHLHILPWKYNWDSKKLWPCVNITELAEARDDAQSIKVLKKSALFVIHFCYFKCAINQGRILLTGNLVIILTFLRLLL